MIEELFDVNSLAVISRYSIEYGVLTENGLKTVTVSILNTDNTISTTEMQIKDVMYFTENGTITLPAQHIFEKVSIGIDQLINNTLSDLIEQALENNISEVEIDATFKQLEFKITNYLQTEYQNKISNINKLNTILYKNTNNQQFLYNPSELKKYLTCKIIKT